VRGHGEGPGADLGDRGAKPEQPRQDVQDAGRDGDQGPRPPAADLVHPERRRPVDHVYDDDRAAEEVSLCPGPTRRPNDGPVAALTGLSSAPTTVSTPVPLRITICRGTAPAGRFAYEAYRRLTARKTRKAVRSPGMKMLLRNSASRAPPGFRNRSHS